MTTATDEKTAKAAAVAARNKEMDAREKVLNAGTTGKGRRISLAMTRGKNPQEISFLSWDESQPLTLPKDISEFMDLRKGEADDEASIIRRLIVGDNEIAYTEASDPVAEYVDAAWDADVQKSFRLVVRQYSANAGVTIEDAVALIKPGFVASQKKA